MKIINKIPEVCFPKGNNTFLRDDFFEVSGKGLSCEEIGTFLTMVSLCNNENYTTFEKLSEHCSEPQNEILVTLNALKTKKLIDIEE